MDPVSNTLCSVRKTRQWTKFRNRVILMTVIYCHQNPLELMWTLLCANVGKDNFSRYCHDYPECTIQ
jgi:hypothetical protein